MKAITIDEDRALLLEQAYAHKVTREQKDLIRLVLPMNYRDFIPVLTDYSLIIQDARDNGNSINSCFSQRLRHVRRFRFNSHTSLFTQWPENRNQLIFSTVVDCEEKSISPLVLRQNPVSVESFKYSDVEKEYQQGNPFVQTMNAYTDRFSPLKHELVNGFHTVPYGKNIQLCIQDLYKGQAQSSFDSVFADEFFGDRSISFAEIRENFQPPPSRQDRDLSPCRGDTIQRAMTSSITIAAQQHTQLLDIPVLYKQDKLGMLTTNRVHPHMLCFFSAPYRRLQMAFNAVQFASQLDTGKPYFDHDFAKSLKNDINQSILFNRLKLAS